MKISREKTSSFHWIELIVLLIILLVICAASSGPASGIIGISESWLENTCPEKEESYHFQYGALRDPNWFIVYDNYRLYITDFENHFLSVGTGLKDEYYLDQYYIVEEAVAEANSIRVDIKYYEIPSIRAVRWDKNEDGIVNLKDL